ncbi:MAG: hypothetical protein J0H98_07005 [Solirubrobacterales bacterium]|nr:hypothetical protein [Solirubrobacterales bacterium]
MSRAPAPDGPPSRFGGGRDDLPTRAELLEAPVAWVDARLARRPLDVIPGVGETFAAQAAEAGATTVGDLLWRVPRAYGKRPGTVLLADLEPGENSAVEIRVIRARKVRTRRRRFSLVEARIADDSAGRKAVWFNQPWMEEKLRADSHWYLEGRLEKGGFVVSAAEQVAGPAAEPGSGSGIRWQAGESRPPGLADDSPRAAHSAGGEIGPGRWRRWSFEACRLAGRLPEPLPATIRRNRGMAGLAAAFREAHFPADATRSGRPWRSSPSRA